MISLLPNSYKYLTQKFPFNLFSKLAKISSEADELVDPELDPTLSTALHTLTSPLLLCCNGGILATWLRHGQR